MNGARLCRWAACGPVIAAFVLLFTGWPGLDVRREKLRVVVSYTDPARATTVLALILLAGVLLVASISLDVHRLLVELRRFVGRINHQ